MTQEIIVRPRNQVSYAVRAARIMERRKLEQHNVDVALGMLRSAGGGVLELTKSILNNPYAALIIANVAIEYIEQSPHPFGLNGPATTWPGLLRTAINTGAAISAVGSALGGSAGIAALIKAAAPAVAA